MEVRWVVFTFKDGFTQEHGGPGDAEAVGSFPFVPYAEEGVPRWLSRGAFHQAVLSELQKSLVASLASGLNAHDLKPGAHRESVVEDQPGESAHLAGSGIMPDPGNDLSNRCVVQPERRPVAVLGKNPNRSVPFERDGGAVRAGSLNLASPGHFFEFQGARGGVGYLAYSESGELFPFFCLRVPKVAYPRVTGVRESIPLAFSTEPQGFALLVGDERVPEYWLSEDFRVAGRL
ncbi:unnamed protein product [Sphagnum troendelagicum]